MNINTLKFCGFILIFITNFAMAASDKGEDKSKNSAPIHLSSDTASYDQQAGLAVYTGNVLVEQGAMNLKADKLNVYLVNKTADRLLATGRPVHFSSKGEKGIIKGQGNKVEYFVSTKIVKITGNAIVTQNGDTVRGSQLSYDLDKELVTGNHVNMTIQPAE